MTMVTLATNNNNNNNNNNDNTNTNQKARRRRGRKGKKEEEQVEKKSNHKTKYSKHKHDHDHHQKQKQDDEITTIISSSLTFNPHKSILIHLTDETPTWYECGRNTPGRDDTIYTVVNNKKVRSNNPFHLVKQYEALAKQIYQHEVELFKSTSGNTKKDERWVENTMKRGTLKDRIAAMSVTLSSDPVHSLHVLDMLLDMCGCGSSSSSSTGGPNARVGQMASQALLDLFLNTLLPSHRKLVPFSSRPLYLYSCNNNNNNNQKTLSPRVLLLWYYESLLKQKYNAYIHSYLSKTLSSDSSLDEYKRFAIQSCTDLLRDVPEGEVVLLGLVVNKLGDPSRKISCCAGHYLRLVLEKHPVMVDVIAREVQQLAHRPHLSSRALYNCIIFLNQLKLKKVDDDYDIMYDKHDDSDNEESDDNADDDNPKHKKTKKTPPAAAPSSLPASLINTYFRLFEVAIKKTKDTTSSPQNNNEHNTNDDTGIKSRLLSALLTGVNRAHPYLPTQDDVTMEQHVDALYKIVHTAPPSASTQALMLLFHLAVGTTTTTTTEEETPSTTNPKPKRRSSSSEARINRFYRALYSKIGDASMLTGKKQLTMFFNLIYKSMKHDPSHVRAVALAKRLLYTAQHASAPIVAGTLFLVSEVMKSQERLMESVVAGGGGGVVEEENVVFDPMKREPKAAFQTKGKAKGKEEEEEEVVGRLWEVSLLSHHFHPSVSKFGESIGNIEYNGDPLRDFALAPFLDKFAYRNPKSVERISRHIRRGESIAERKSGIEGGIHLATAPPVNDPDFIRKEEVGESEEFFHRFFVERAKRDEIKGVVRGGGGSKSDAGADDVLDAVESGVVDKLDEGWDTDPEEEEFATALAEKLIEQHSHGKAHFDDEDPDMEGWSDLDDDSDDDEGEEGEGNEFSKEIKGGSDENSDDDSEEDAILLQSDDDDSDEGDTGGIDVDGDAFMDADDSDSDDDDDGKEPVGIEVDDSDEGQHGFEVGEFPDFDEDDSDDDDMNNKSTQEVKKGKEKLSTSFVDASEYEDIIAKGWADRKRGRDMDDDEEPAITKEKSSKQRQDGSGKKKRKKRKKQR